MGCAAVRCNCVHVHMYNQIYIFFSLIKLHTFMVMYKAHCQRILDSVVRANFAEVSFDHVCTYIC